MESITDYLIIISDEQKKEALKKWKKIPTGTKKKKYYVYGEKEN